jgi:methyl-accepting chemotaxis protein
MSHTLVYFLLYHFLGGMAHNYHGRPPENPDPLKTQVSNQVKEISTSIQQMAASSQQTVLSVKKIDEFSKKSAGESQGVSAVGGGQIPRIIC